MLTGIFDVLALIINTQQILLSYHLKNGAVIHNSLQDDPQRQRMRLSSHGNPYLDRNKVESPYDKTTDVYNATKLLSKLKTSMISKSDKNDTDDTGVESKSECPCDSGYKCVFDSCTVDVRCPAPLKFGSGPPKNCLPPTDPNQKPPTDLEKWLTKEVFNDLFPKANIGWGPQSCWPYSYDAFVIAARYFPQFGTESPANGYTVEENTRRDVATFFAHAVQETGENDASLYETYAGDVQKANACFYRGGFYNWFEGGPTSSFLHRDSPGYQPADGDQCFFNGLYCPVMDTVNTYFYPCNNATTIMDDGPSQKPTKFYKGCYLGRGAIQISYNFNYKQFQDWLKTQDIAVGNWNPGPVNEAAKYVGPILGPTSLVINNECNGEDEGVLGGPGESRRIKAFKWFCSYFNVPVGAERTLTCKNMPQQLGEIKHSLSWQPDWTTSWKDVPCQCAPATYAGTIPYFQPEFYPLRFVDENERNREYCVFTIYDKPILYGMENSTSACLNQPRPIPHVRGTLEKVTFEKMP